MRRKRIMLIGPQKSGKTTLAALLEGREMAIRRVPNMVYREKTLDTPGAYLESPWMHKHLIAAAQDACCVVMAADAAGKKRAYPPAFAKAFRVPVIGVVTRCDLPDANPESARRQLLEAGVPEPVLLLSIREAESVQAFLKTLAPHMPPSYETQRPEE